MTIPHFYESIPGWFNFQDIYAEQVARARDGAVFVEVGSWLGRSAAFMAVEIANSGKRIEFWCVDTWAGSPAPQYQEVVKQHGGSVYNAFLENMLAGGVREHVRTMRMDSAEAASGFKDGSIDFVFIDGAHDFHSVSRDVRAWLPKIATDRPAVIGGHDANCPGLMNAVKQWISAEDIWYRGTSWLRFPSTDAHQGEYGVVDQSLEEWAGADIQRRLSLSGPVGPIELPPTPPDRYVAKWGGPPGHETYTFPYGISTEDW